MTKKEYGFSDEVKKNAHKRANEIGIRGKKDVHHIVPRSVARKYNLNKSIITSEDNAIALEQNTVHKEIHEVWEESDYITMAITLLGFTEEDFENVRTNRPKGYRKKKRRRR